MNKTLISSLTALALCGAMATIAPAIAAPGVTPTDINCWTPANRDDPRCVDARRQRGNQDRGATPGQHQGQPPAANQNNANPPAVVPSQPATQPRRGGNNNATDNNNPNDYNNRFDRGGNDSGNFDRNNNDNGRFDNNRNDNRRFDYNRNDRQFNGRGNDFRSFRDFRRQYDFPRFDQPRFSIRRGAPVPRSFRLRPLPFEMVIFYPQYRGFLYFMTRDGSIVVVSPRSYRIVDVL